MATDDHRWRGTHCSQVHTTFQYGGAPGKRHRLREAMLWHDEPKYYAPTKPDQTRPNQTKPEQTKPEQTKPDRTKPNQTEPNRIRPN